MKYLFILLSSLIFTNQVFAKIYNKTVLHGKYYKKGTDTYFLTKSDKKIRISKKEYYLNRDTDYLILDLKYQPNYNINKVKISKLDKKDLTYFYKTLINFYISVEKEKSPLYSHSNFLLRRSTSKKDSLSCSRKELRKITSSFYKNDCGKRGYFRCSSSMFGSLDKKNDVDNEFINFELSNKNGFCVKGNLGDNYHDSISQKCNDASTFNKKRIKKILKAKDKSIPQLERLKHLAICICDKGKSNNACAKLNKKLDKLVKNGNRLDSEVVLVSCKKNKSSLSKNDSSYVDGLRKVFDDKKRCTNKGDKKKCLARLECNTARKLKLNVNAYCDCSKIHTNNISSCINEENQKNL